MTDPSALPAATADRFLAYTADQDLRTTVVATQSATASGMVICSDSPVKSIRLAKSLGYGQPLIADVGAWRRQNATPGSPTLLEAPDSLLQISVDDWADELLTAGASAVLTPSKFIRAGDWDSLRAVLRAADRADLDRVLTLIATDAAMLDPPCLTTFMRTLNTTRSLAFIFADKSHPLGRRGRAAGLRNLVAAFPGCALLATEPIVATDAYAHGAGCAAIGITGGLRRPRRPGDNGGSNAKDFLPGLFLREMWEHRSPSVYADWFANSPPPTCDDCGGRAIHRFYNNENDRLAVLRHNVHAWLGLYDELGPRSLTGRWAWSSDEWATALAAHVSLRPAHGTVEADPVLRQLVELDDPQGRRTTPQGVLR